MNENDLEIGEVVMCTVERISGIMVFVKIHTSGKDLEGGIILSEIAPGRIRNLREYVVPKKRIACKVIRIIGNRIDLSLRRVTPKEKKEILDKFKQEKSCKSVLKSVLGEKSKELITNILKEDSVYNFCEKTKEDTKKLEKLVGKEDAIKINEILNKQKSKKVILKKEISLNSLAPNGLEKIKKILGEKNKEIEMKYLSAGRYTLKTESSEIKKADNKLKETITEIEKQAKKEGLIFSILEK